MYVYNKMNLLIWRLVQEIVELLKCSSSDDTSKEYIDELKCIKSCGRYSLQS